MQSGSDPPGHGPKPVRRSPRLSPQVGSSEGTQENKGGNSLQELKRRGRMERTREEREEELSGKLKTLDLSSRSAASGTGLVYSEIFTHHKNEWDPSHPESPERVTAIMEELERQDLLPLCIRVEPREATEEELLLAHMKHYVDLIKSTQTMTLAELQTLSNKYDSIYLHPESFQVVLIVDWDVHHGQGIQYRFQEDPSVLYFSVHRYEQGSFWPHLPESDSHFVGSGPAEGRNINLPWNQTGMTDADYIAAFQQVLLPVAYEFQPQLVLVSAGFDAAVGDLKMCRGNLQELESPFHFSSSNFPLPPFRAEGSPSAEGRAISTSTSQKNTMKPNLAPSVATTTGLVYDERMMEHSNLWDRHHPEQPQRIFKIFSKHQQLGLVDRCQRIPVRLATEEELSLCHSMQHIEQMKATAAMKPRELHKLGDEFVSIYLNQQSFQCAQLAAGSCLNALDQILCGQVTNAVAIVRPPGHHAERDYPCGFCLFNTAALAARYAKKASHDPSMRILILDWDVHHGNGTQHMFEDDDSVLYISLHRYDNGAFFPSSEDAAPDKVGVAKGAGFNVNVAWSGGRMGDSDYLAAFHRVVMPIATEFNPSLVLVSAGFDAARGDPLGGYNVTPEGYAHLTHMLMSLAGGRVLVILEKSRRVSDCPSLCLPLQSTLYVVDPLSWCPHLDAVKPLPSSGIDVFRPCQDCGSEAENWICLTCYQVFCGRYVNEHMVNHGVVSEHPLVLSFCDLSAWCYQCEAYVHNQILFEAKNAAHCAKFGEEIPPWS
ncbi:histone deacetylase 6 [Neolamprologus brichardi]|uniref:histone deacetylase 6 n=1 Tax=Neolamprologus brichardi TaxID=32507 RepID=UPI001643DEBA|nr:histone deacetylase 6 [Neolamprologus brichardi]